MKKKRIFLNELQEDFTEKVGSLMYSLDGETLALKILTANAY
jgi:hypothetical protein